MCILHYRGNNFNICFWMYLGCVGLIVYKGLPWTMSLEGALHLFQSFFFFKVENWDVHEMWLYPTIALAIHYWSKSTITYGITWGHFSWLSKSIFYPNNQNSLKGPAMYRELRELTLKNTPNSLSSLLFSLLFKFPFYFKCFFHILFCPLPPSLAPNSPLL